MNRAEIDAIRARFVAGEMPTWDETMLMIVEVRVLREALDAERESLRLVEDEGLRAW